MGFLIDIIPLVLAVWFIITFIKYKKSGDEKIERPVSAVVMGCVASVVVVLSYLFVIAVIVGMFSFSLPKIAKILIALIPYVLTVVFTITAKGFHKNSNIIVLGCIAAGLAALPFTFVVAVIIGSMSFGLLAIAAPPIVLAVLFAVTLKRYLKKSDTDEIKRKRGIRAIIFGSVSWFMMYALDSFLLFLLSGVINAM